MEVTTVLPRYLHAPLYASHQWLRQLRIVSNERHPDFNVFHQTLRLFFFLKKKEHDCAGGKTLKPGCLPLLTIHRFWHSRRVRAVVRVRRRFRSGIDTEGMSPRKASSVPCGGSRWINLYQCPGERQESRLVCQQGSRPSEGYTVFHLTLCYGGCGGGYVSGFPEWGNPVHSQIQVCVRREVACIPDTGSDGSTVRAVKCARQYEQFWTPGKDGWIKCADRSFVEMEIGSQETLCYQRAEVELETVLVSEVIPRLLGKGVCESLYGEGMSHSVVVADIAPRMTAKEGPSGWGEGTPDSGSYGGTRDSEFVHVYSENRHMASAAVEHFLKEDEEVKGFSFENCRRNAFLAKQGAEMPKARKTGTTICGVMFNEGVVLGADTRATGGSIVCDLNCEKIHYIADNVFCCGAGTAADTEFTTNVYNGSIMIVDYCLVKNAINFDAQQHHQAQIYLFKGPQDTLNFSLIVFFQFFRNFKHLIVDSTVTPDLVTLRFSDRINFDIKLFNITLL
eukprot:sb/3463995/